MTIKNAYIVTTINDKYNINNFTKLQKQKKTKCATITLKTC